MTDDCVLRDCGRLLYSYFLFFSALPSKLVILYNYFFMTPRNKIADRGQAGDELHPWCCLSPQDGAAIMNAKGLESLQNSVVPKLDDCLIRYRYAQFRISPCLSEFIWIMLHVSPCRLPKSLTHGLQLSDYSIYLLYHFPPIQSHL